MSLEVSVIIPTHNPDAGRLRRTLAALGGQTLPTSQWEIVLVDNASSPAVDAASIINIVPPNLRIVREPQLGLTSARRRGFIEAKAPVFVLVDDDNVLAADYLAHVVRLFGQYPRVGALGGRSLPEFEAEPAPWQHEFLPLLALRDLGDAPRLSGCLRPSGMGRNEYPAAAPIGAGMSLRREATHQWLDESVGSNLTDRRGSELSSGGDNDIVLTLMRLGWEVAYFPELSLTHLIPSKRLEVEYLARLNRGIQKSWMRVLTKHDANPWQSIPRWSVFLRKLKAWIVYRAWSGPAERIRWEGACGHFEGRSTP